MRYLLSLPLLLLSLDLSAASPPAESFDRLDEPFPDMVFRSPEGAAVKLSDYRGKVVLVKLWATWCAICRAKWPEHQALYDRLRQEPEVQMITISIFEDQQKSQDWVTARGYDVPLFKNVITDRGAVPVVDGSYYFVKGTPMIFLIDKNGVLRKKAVANTSKISEADIRELI
jgi:thiol-disulfide isomerase/thioredoxin